MMKPSARGYETVWDERGATERVATSYYTSLIDFNITFYKGAEIVIFYSL